MDTQTKCTLKGPVEIRQRTEYQMFNALAAVMLITKTYWAQDIQCYTLHYYIFNCNILLFVSKASKITLPNFFYLNLYLLIRSQSIMVRASAFNLIMF